MSATIQSSPTRASGVARWTGLTLLGVAGGVLCIVAVALALSGPAETAVAIREWLDSNHLWGPRTESARLTRHYASANPEADARVAVRAGDLRLMSSMWCGTAFPGVPRKNNTEYERRFGSRAPIDSMYVPKSIEGEALLPVACEYAKRYNLTVLESVKR